MHGLCGVLLDRARSTRVVVIIIIEIQQQQRLRERRQRSTALQHAQHSKQAAATQARARHPQALQRPEDSVRHHVRHLPGARAPPSNRRHPSLQLVRLARQNVRQPTRDIEHRPLRQAAAHHRPDHAAHARQEPRAQLGGHLQSALPDQDHRRRQLPGNFRPQN